MSKLETNTIDNISGSSTLNIGDTNATNITIDNGVTTLDFGTGISTVSNIPKALSNTPAFEAYLSADQTGITDVTETKVQVNTESFDTDNCYDNSTNYRFTPTVAGKYYVYGRVSIDEAAGNTRNALAYIYKNGSEKVRSFVNFHSSLASDGEGASPTVSAVIDFNGSSDYVELYTNHGMGSTRSTIGAFLGGYKIIGA